MHHVLERHLRHAFIGHGSGLAVLIHEPEMRRLETGGAWKRESKTCGIILAIFGSPAGWTIACVTHRKHIDSRCPSYSVCGDCFPEAYLFSTACLSCSRHGRCGWLACLFRVSILFGRGLLYRTVGHQRINRRMSPLQLGLEGGFHRLTKCIHYGLLRGAHLGRWRTQVLSLGVYQLSRISSNLEDNVVNGLPLGPVLAEELALGSVAKTLNGPPRAHAVLSSTQTTPSPPLLISWCRTRIRGPFSRHRLEPGSSSSVVEHSCSSRSLQPRE